MEKFELRYDEARDLFTVSWLNKRPKIESALHKLGGEWDDFNRYRFPAQLDMVKTLNTEVKKIGKLTMSDLETKQHVQRMVLKDHEVKELTSGDSDAELSEYLVEQYPETAKALRPYQRAAAKFMSINKYTLLADHPGTGKTLSTIAALVGDPSVEGDILILSPSIATQVSWPTELKKWAPDDEVVRVVGSRAKREEALQALRVKPKGKRRWILCNVDMAKVKYHKETVSEGKRSKSWYQCVYPELFYYDFNQAKPKNDREWGVIVLDEAHKVLVTDKSQAYKQTQIRCGLGRLKVKENGKRFALTGTPFRGKLENLWGTLNWLDPKKYSSYHKWISQWFPTEDGFFGGKEIKEIQPEKKKPFFDAIAPFTLRRTKGEIAKDLPPKVYVGDVPEGISYDPGEEAGLVGHWLDMGPKQKRAYHEMVEHAMASLESGNLVANGVLAELTRLKQFAGTYGEIVQKEDSDGFLVDHFRPALPSNKFDWLLQFLEELGIVKGSLAQGPDDNKVVVASQFTSVLNLFEKELKKKGIEVYKITGGVSMKKREEAAHVFQTDTGPQVMLLNTYAGGVALTLDRADDIVILDETFIPDDQEQVEDRVHRVSRNHNVFIHYVRSLGTIEERIARTTFGRDTVQKEILDGERGIDFARKLL